MRISTPRLFRRPDDQNLGRWNLGTGARPAGCFKNEHPSFPSVQPARRAETGGVSPVRFSVGRASLVTFRPILQRKICWFASPVPDPAWDLLNSHPQISNYLLRLVQLVFILTVAVLDGLAEMRVVINLRQGTGAFGSVDAAGRVGLAAGNGTRRRCRSSHGQQLVK